MGKKKVVVAPDAQMKLAPAPEPGQSAPVAQIEPEPPTPGQNPQTYTDAQVLYLEQEKAQLVAQKMAEASPVPTPPSGNSSPKKPAPNLPMAPAVVSDRAKSALKNSKSPSGPVPKPMSPSELAAKLQEIEDAAEAQKAKLLKDAEVARLAAKLASVNDAAPVDIEAIASRVTDKLESAAVQAKVDAQLAEQSRLAKLIAPARKDAQRELDELRELQDARSEVVPALGWDGPELERRKLFLPSQRGRYIWAQDTLKAYPNFISQLERAIADMDALPTSGLRGRHLEQEWKMIASVCHWSIGCAFNTRRAIRDLKRLLLELDATTLKAAPKVAAEVLGKPAPMKYTGEPVGAQKYAEM